MAYTCVCMCVLLEFYFKTSKKKSLKSVRSGREGSLFVTLRPLLDYSHPKTQILCLGTDLEFLSEFGRGEKQTLECCQWRLLYSENATVSREAISSCPNGVAGKQVRESLG